ncbi:hypothetical protein [Algibacter aquimarinus]|uniref:Cell wall anchor protein n=1 Tax=Algibacter aquimarinus TaxID=1136748 RepID=A0ABP9HNX1_9FLAO
MKNILPKLLTLFCLFSLELFPQVGINTTSPDASAVLDMVSTTQGVLTPRMTSAQRLLIVTPAEGLLVFDTDQNAFYFYNGTEWIELDKRNNYKLVKSVADLADELLAGGGASYLLTSNTYYEINGTITLAAPIDINDAYISGLDANEDVLVRVGGEIFSGANGGSLRNLTLVAPGGSIFNLSGSGAETLVFQNCIVANSGSLGNISSFGVVFMNIIQIVNNSDGITFTNIDSLLLSNVAWFGNNAGTFETYVGTFSLIEKISGFCTVPSGAVGIDVSADPTVTTGVINSTTFSGAGTYINGYTTGSYVGFNFNNAWDINCPGIPVESDAAATGYYYMAGNTTNTNFVTNNVAVKVGGLTTSDGLFRMSSIDNRLVYEGREAREFQVICTGALDHGTTATPNGRIYEFFLSKTPNGGSPTLMPAISSERRFSNNDVGNFSMVGLIFLEPGDAIEIWVSINNASNVDTDFTRLSVVLK